MKLSWFIIFLLIGFCPTASGQLSFGIEFDNTLNRAEQAFQLEKYEEAGKLYDQALNLKGGRYPLSGYYGDALKAWSKAGEVDKSFFYLERLVNKGWISLHDLNHSLYFEHMRKDSRWDSILRIVEEKDSVYGNVKLQLERIQREDQALRKIMGCAREEFEGDSLSLAYFYRLMGRQDSLNLEQVEVIVETYGWLGENKIGDKANSTLWLVIQHAPLETQKKYLPLIRQSVLLGETPASKLAFLRDRMAYYRREKQYYGTQVVKIEESGEYKPYPIKAPQYVNRRRAEIGLEPLAEYLKFFGIEESRLESLDDPTVFEYLKDK